MATPRSARQRPPLAPILAASIRSSGPRRRCPMARRRSSRRRGAARRRRWSPGSPCCSTAGVPPDRICVVTFNRDAARDLAARVERRLGPSVPAATAIEVRTLHALARQVLLDAGEGTNLVADRLPLLRAARRRARATREPQPLPEAAAARHVALGLEDRGPTAARRGVRGSSTPMPTCSPRAGPSTSTTSSSAPATCSSPMRAVRAALAGPLQPRVRRRVPGRRRRAAPARPPPRRTRGQPLRGRRRRPDDLRMAARRCAQDPALRRRLPGRPPRHARHELPVPARRRRRLGAHRRRQPRALHQADPGSRGQSPRTAPFDLGVEHRRCGLAVRWRGLATRESAAGRTLCFLSRTRGELTPILLALVRAGVRHTDGVRAARRVGAASSR